MGADLISTFLYFPTEEHNESESPWVRPKFLLDFDAAKVKARELVAGWSVEDLAIFHSSGMDEALPTDDVDGVRTEAIETIEAMVDEVREDIEGGGRDIDYRFFKNFGEAFTAGMSWGDSPTDAFDRWTKFQNDEEFPGGTEVLKAAGFILDIYDRARI